MKKVSIIFSKYLICISTYNWLSWISFTKCKEVKMTWGPDILHIQHIRDHMVKLQLDKNSVPRIKRFYPWTGTHLHGAVLVASWAVPIVWRIGGLHVLHRVQIFNMRQCGWSQAINSTTFTGPGHFVDYGNTVVWFLRTCWQWGQIRSLSLVTMLCTGCLWV